ncbi:MAG: flagellar hook capping protein [Lachnospiraceae bacterium]|nr:flagellar hook capping protein [Lachnospiraceae bacterium]
MVSASVVDGILQQTATTSSDKSKKTSGGSSLGKDDFLQLLVAQMKYQDPLEPTSNTEYISQYATFSELEQMQNMSSTMELSRASDLVGKTVVVETTDATGKTSSDMGVVDYISYENNKALVWVNGQSWLLDDVKEVADPAYIEAYSMAVTLNTALNKLPNINALTVQDKDAVDSISQMYEGMDEYQQSFVAQESVEKIKNYVQKMQELIKLQELADDNNREAADDDTQTKKTTV